MKPVFEFKITFWICVLMLWIHKGYYAIKKLLWNDRFKAYWYTKYIHKGNFLYFSNSTNPKILSLKCIFNTWVWYSSYKSVGNISKHSPTNLNIKININVCKNIIKVMKNPDYEKIPCAKNKHDWFRLFPRYQKFLVA